MSKLQDIIEQTRLFRAARRLPPQEVQALRNSMTWAQHAVATAKTEWDRNVALTELSRINHQLMEAAK